MRSSRVVSNSLGSEEGSSTDIPKMLDSQESSSVPLSTPKSTLNTENRSRYSMNYQSYEATRIQPGEQTRRMLDYMFPGYQKRDPRNWYEMQTQTDLGGFEVNRLIGTELTEGEPIESYEDRKKSFGDTFGDDASDYEGSPTFEKKAAAKRGHRSSVLSRAWEGPPIKMSGKSSHEGFHLEVDDYYHEPQTILVPRDIIEHQELKMDIVPDDQGVPKVVIYLGSKDPSDPIVKEQPDDTIILFDGKEDFDGTSSDESPEPASPEELVSPVIVPETLAVSSEELPESEEPLTIIRDSLDVVPPNVVRTEPEPPQHESSSVHSEDSADQFLYKGQKMNNSVFLEPIKATGSHSDLYEDVIEPRIEEPSPPPKEPTPPPPKEPTPPPPKEPTPPPPKEPSSPPREPSPLPREPTPPPKEPSPPPKDPTPPPKEPTPPPKEPTLVESPKSVSRESLSPEPYLPPQESPPSVVTVTPSPPSASYSPPPVSTASIPSQTSSHIGSPPDHLFGPLENYPDDLEEESDKIIHSPSPQLRSPSRDEESDHPFSVTDDYPPQYSPPPREGSDVSSWLEANILSQARNVAKSPLMHKSHQKPPVAELPVSFQEQKSEISVQDLQPDPAQISTQQLKPQISVQEPDQQGDKPKPSKAARFRDDERLSNPRALEERFSIYYPPPKPKNKKGDLTGEVPVDGKIEDHHLPDVNEEDHHSADLPDGRADDTSDYVAEDKAVDLWLEDEILNPAAVDDWVDTKIMSEARKSPRHKGISSQMSPPRPVDRESELVDAWIEGEILQSAQVDNWVTNKIMKPAEKLSDNEGEPETKPVATLPVTAQPSPTSSQSVSNTSSDSGTSGQSLDESVAELQQPNLLSKPAIASPPPTTLAPPVITSPPTTLPREIRENSDKSVDVNEEEVDSWIANELLSPAEADAWLEKKVIQPAQAEKWVNHQVIKPATAQSYVNENITKPASVLSYIDEKIMKPSAVKSYIDDKIIELAEAESYVDQNIVKPAEAETRIDQNIVKPAEAETRIDSKVIGKVPKSIVSKEVPDDRSVYPAKQPSLEFREPTIVTSDIPLERLTVPAPVDSLQVAMKPSRKDSPVDMMDEKVISGMPLAEDGRMGEPPKRFQMPETCRSDINLQGPFQPQPDCPDEYPQGFSEVQLIVEPTAQPKPVEPVVDTTKMFTEDRVETSQIPVDGKSETSVTQVQEYPTVKEAESSDAKIQKYPSVEKSPARSPHASLISIDRKPSLKQKSDSGNISKMKLHDLEPEKRDRPSILAKKAMETDNYLLRDEEDEYIHPKLQLDTNALGEKRKSSTTSKKICPLSNLFKRKRSSSPGPSTFITPSHNRRGSSVGEGSRKFTKSLSLIDEEEFIASKPSNTVEKKPIKDKISTNLVAPSSQQTKLDDPSKIPRGSTEKSGCEGKDNTGGSALILPLSSISTTTNSVDFHGTSIVPSTLGQPTQSPSQVKSPAPVASPSQDASPFQVTFPSQVASPSQVVSSSLAAPASPDTSPVQTDPHFHAATPAQHSSQANVPLGPEVAARNESPKIQRKVSLVMPEDLHIAFPKFPDYEEAMKNQKNPEKIAGKKSVPNPPKGGLPMFPDYKQLTEPHSESVDPSFLKKDPVDDHFSGTLVNKPNKHEDDERFKGQVPTSGSQSISIFPSATKGTEMPPKTSGLPDDEKIEKTPLKDLAEIKTTSLRFHEEPRLATDTFLEKKVPEDIKRFEAERDIEKDMMESPVLEPTKTNVKLESESSTEPRSPGNGVPVFPDYNEITLGPDYMLSRPQHETGPHQLSASSPKGSPVLQEGNVLQGITSQQQPSPYWNRETPSTYQIQQPMSVGPYAPQPQAPTYGAIQSRDYAPVSPQMATMQQPHTPIYGTTQPQESTSMPYSSDKLVPLQQVHPDAVQQYQQDSTNAPLSLSKLDKPHIASHLPSQPIQVQSFRKHNYSQPDKPLQRVSTPRYASAQSAKPSSGGGYRSPAEPFTQGSSFQKEKSGTFDQREQPHTPTFGILPPQESAFRPHSDQPPYSDSEIPSSYQTQQPLSIGSYAPLSPQMTTLKQEPHTSTYGAIQPQGSISRSYSPDQSQQAPQQQDQPHAPVQPAALQKYQQDPYDAIPQFPQDSPPMTPYGVDRPPVSSSPYESGQRQQKGLGRTGQPLHQRIPSSDGYLSIKQRPAPQSNSSAVTPLGEGQQQGPYDPYSKDPHNQTYGPGHGRPGTSSHRPLPGFTEQAKLAVSPYGESLQKEPYGSLSSPYSTAPATSTQQPLAPGYSPYKPADGRPSASTSKAPLSTHQLPQQAPCSPAITSTPGGTFPTLQKHTYSHPEQPLPLTPVRPHGLEDEDASPQREGFNTDTPDHQQDRISRQTTPVKPGGGIPLFPDFEEASKPNPKPPTMTGDFKRVAPKPRTVTAEDKKAEFDKEILPIMEQIRDLKRQMYELTPQRGPPMKTGPVQSHSLPSSLQLYNELEKRTLAATKTDREDANAQRRKQVYEENARRKIQRAIERSQQTK